MFLIKQSYFSKNCYTETFQWVTNQRKCKSPDCFSEYELSPLKPETYKTGIETILKTRQWQ